MSRGIIDKTMQKIFFLCLLSCCLSQVLRAGLILEVDPTIDVSNVKKVVLLGDDLVVYYGSSQQRVLELPKGALNNIVVWAKQDCNGPFVFSVDGALVPGAPNYGSPCVPQNMHSIMFSFDVFAHNLSRGHYSVRAEHPLIRLTGSDSKMPGHQFARLMDLSNTSVEAIWYRRLAEKYYYKTDGIGEFTIKAQASKNGFPIQLSVRSHRWLRPTVWTRSVSVPNQWEHWAMDLPFRYLKEDIEGRWNTYRGNFKMMDELSTVVEAYAILKNLISQRPTLWNDFIVNLSDGLTNSIRLPSVRSSNYDYLRSDFWSSSPSWRELSLQSIGRKIDNITQAHLALAILWRKSNYGSDMLLDNWIPQLELFAEKNIAIKGKLLLLEIILAEDDSIAEGLVGTFFKFCQENPSLFRIRVMGYKYLKESRYSYDFSQERKSILNDWITLVDDLSLENDKMKRDFLYWEELSQNVYSVGLLDLVTEEYGYLYPLRFATKLATVHYMRGKAFQKGEELAYRHAHFRYLKYLAENSEWEYEFSEKIQQYRGELAQQLGMNNVEWDENKMEGIYNYGETYPVDKSDSVDRNPKKNKKILKRLNESTGLGKLVQHGFVGKIEGTIVSSNYPFDHNRSKKSITVDVKQGVPAAVLGLNGDFTLLLLDSRTLMKLVEARTSNLMKIRVEGVLSNSMRAITPFSLEYYEEGEWRSFDLPYSGVLGPNSLTSDNN